MIQSFSKTSKQKEAIPILAKHYATALYGGSRSGKTFIIIYALIIRAAKCKSRHVILRRTFSSVKRAVFLDTFPKVMAVCFPNLPYEQNRTDWFITLPNGSEIWFGGLDDAKRSEKILGMEFSTIYFNEASELDYSSIQIAISRLAEKNILKKRLFFDFNPPTKSHWSYQLFIKKLDPIESEPLDDPDDYAHLLMNPMDNLENLDPQYLKILQKMPEKDRQRFLEGLFSDSSDGQVYYSFIREKHVKSIKPYSGTVFIGMDFNIDPLTAVVIYYDNVTFFVLDEIFLRNSDTFKMVNELNSRGYRGARIIPDSTASNRKTSGMSDVDILEQAGFVVESTRNPFVMDRTNNMNRLFQENRIVIDPKCKKLIGDLEKVVWKDGKLDQKTDPMLTHISDALGYGCWFLDPIGLHSSAKIRIY